MALIWRPGKASRGNLVLVAALSVLAYMAVEGMPQQNRKAYYKEKLRAARQMEKGMEVIRQARTSIFGRINAEQDPLGGGLIGSPLTPITSKAGKLSAKQAAANPNYAALMVHFFKRAGLKEGDVVAMAFSGSFPSLNLAALVAAETLGLKPVAITSNSASQFGATDPELTWLDMERLLFEKGVVHERSLAASMGGHEDRGKEISPEGVRMLRESIKRNGVELIDPPDLTADFDLRMNIYREASGESPIAAYVNIGGGVGSVGSLLVKHAFQPGLNKTTPHPGRLGDSVMSRMSREGIPVIHVIEVEKLAKQYGIVIPTDRPPKVGEGHLFSAMGYNLVLVWGVLIGLIGALFLVLRMDLAHYLLRMRKRFGNGKQAPPPANP